MAKTFVDQLVEYPSKVVSMLGSDKTIVELLTDNPDIVIGTDEADDVFDKCLYDYGYTDETTLEAIAYICVEAEIPRVMTETMQSIKLYVTVLCQKQYMKLDPAKFKKLLGNRRDNLTRYIDKILDKSTVFGIGELNLESIRTVPSPAGFSARELEYSISDFHTKAVL